MAKIGQNCQKWLFFDVFQEKCPVATGLKLGKMAKIGQNLQNGLKVQIWRSWEFPRGVVLHQPLAAGPCPRPGAPGSSPGRHVAESLLAAPGLEGECMVFLY